MAGFTISLAALLSEPAFSSNRSTDESDRKSALVRQAATLAGEQERELVNLYIEAMSRKHAVSLVSAAKKPTPDAIQKIQGILAQEGELKAVGVVVNWTHATPRP